MSEKTRRGGGHYTKARCSQTRLPLKYNPSNKKYHQNQFIIREVSRIENLLFCSMFKNSAKCTSWVQLTLNLMKNLKAQSISKLKYTNRQLPFIQRLPERG